MIFPPALKYLARYVKDSGYDGPTAYWSSAYRRDASPLLDELAVAVDHVTAFSVGGAHDEANFVMACYKCNVRKNARTADEFHRKHPPRPPVKGIYGEPRAWDGFTAVFMVMARLYRNSLTRSELDWLTALESDSDPDVTAGSSAPSAASSTPPGSGGGVRRRPLPGR